MNWLKFENAFTGWTVRVVAEQVMAVHQATSETTELQLVGGGKVVVKGDAEEIYSRILAAYGPKRAGGKVVETR